MKCIMFMLFVLTVNTCFAQIKKGNPQSINMLIEDYLIRTLNLNEDSTNIICERGVVFALFSIQKGQISNVSFSGAKRPFVISALKKSLDSLGSDPVVMLTLNKTDETFLLPLIYDYQLGCKFPKVEGNVPNDTYYKTYLDVWMERDILMPSLMNMLNFKGIKQGDKNWILLPPFTIGNMGH